MRRRPGTGVPAASDALASLALMVCGESHADVFETTDRILSHWSVETVSWGFREFFIRSYSLGGRSMTVMVGGLGSASVEVLLQEAVQSGVKRVLLSGSCASLKPALAVGDLIVPETAILRPGAFSEYDSRWQEAKGHTEFRNRLLEYLHWRGIEAKTGKMISTDAFYALGGARDAEGRAVYAGADLRDNYLPEGLDLALRNPLQAEALDMECASFFALASLMTGVEAIALKCVSNPIPWDESFDEGAIKDHLETALRTALEFLAGCS